MQRDSLGDRMKDHERRAEVRLPRRTHTIIRIDGKAFHTYTRGLERPYDAALMADMASTAKHLAENVSGCQLAYAQSDEISLLLTDFASPGTQAWFDNKLQKVVSVSASMATAAFNRLRPHGDLALFDARAFTLADPEEVANYFVWRQKDAVRNSIAMAAQSLFSHMKLQGVSAKDMQEMLWSQHQLNWNDYDPRFKRGQLVSRFRFTEPLVYTDMRTQQVVTIPEVRRTVWRDTEAPTFTAHREWLLRVIAGEALAAPVG